MDALFGQRIDTTRTPSGGRQTVVGDSLWFRLKAGRVFDSARKSPKPKKSFSDTVEN